MPNITLLCFAVSRVAGSREKCKHTSTHIYTDAAHLPDHIQVMRTAELRERELFRSDATHYIYTLTRILNDCCAKRLIFAK